MTARELRTGELAERAGVKVQTLRYYERRGLLTAPAAAPLASDATRRPRSTGSAPSRPCSALGSP
jgi:hypothetical protein